MTRYVGPIYVKDGGWPDDKEGREVHHHVFKYDKYPDETFISFESAIASEVDPDYCIECHRVIEG